MFTMRLPAEIDATLSLLADKTHRPKSFYVLQALTTNQSLEDLEDIYLADTAYEEWVKNGKKTISLEEMERRLGLAD